MGPEIADETRGRVFQQAAYVHRYAGSGERARHFADIAVELALQNNLFELAARAYSVTYTIEHDEADDPVASLKTLAKISECAKKSASSRARIFSLIASYEIEVDRGDDAALERLDAEIEEHQASVRLISTALLPARAMRTAWSGDFTGAYELLRGSSTDEPSPEWQALRSAEIALYAAAAGMQQEAEEPMTLAGAALEKGDPRRRRSIRTRLLLALAHLVRGHHTAAHRYISEGERALEPRMHRIRSLAQATRAIYRASLQQAGAHEVAESFDRLRSEHFGGMARLLKALPLGEVSSAGVAILTPAEREVLQLLALGASTKQVAAKTGRSPHTVDTHIRSICRKLGCSGRREAVALATSQGWVQT
jgi:DNA-binding CsgD family transcriptional regulator